MSVYLCISSSFARGDDEIEEHLDNFQNMLLDVDREFDGRHGMSAPQRPGICLDGSDPAARNKSATAIPWGTAPVAKSGGAWASTPRLRSLFWR